jgi:hypothetical protein
MAEQRQNDQTNASKGKAILESWPGIIAALTLIFFSALFIFQLGYFQYIGFGFLGLIGTSDLLINATIMIPPVVGVVVGFALGIESNFKLINDLFDLLLAQRVARFIFFFLYMAAIIYFIFTDPLIGVLLIPAYSSAGIFTLFIIYYWTHAKRINYYHVAGAIVMLGFSLLLSGYVSARNMVCCSKDLYTIKSDDGILESARILRSSDNGVLYSLGPTIAFISKDHIVQVFRARSDLGK